MDEFFDPSNSLFCDEIGKDLCFDGLDDDDGDIKSEPLIHPLEQSDEGFLALLEREIDYLPKHDYLDRLRSGDLDLCLRNEAFHWISKAHCYHSFGPLSLCLAMNYLDRFLSVRELPRDKDWTVQLLAVACLSIAAKIEETSMPLSLELQVGDPKYVFEAKTIQKMELLVLDTLQWKMNAVTPCSFLDYSLKQLCNPHNIIHKYLFSTTKVVNRSMELILCTMKGIDYLEFKASEIAAAVAMSVAAEIQAVDIDKASYCFIHLNKDRVFKCVVMMKKMSSQMSRIGSMQQGVPLSPIGVLDVACFSYKSDEFTSSHSHVSSSSNSSQITATASATPIAMTINSGTKRMKLDPTSTAALAVNDRALDP